MKIPERAPDWLTILKDNISALVSRKDYAQINELISAIDQKEEYLYWDNFKQLQLLAEIKPEVAWSYLKFTRLSKTINTKLTSKESNFFKYWIPDSILRSLSEIDKYIGGQILVDDGTPFNQPEHKRYLVNSLMEEAIASSQLEGASTTRKAAKEMLRSARKPQNHAEKMIYNNYQTILKIKAFVDKPLDEQLILELHKSMTIDTLEKPDWSGRFRASTDESIVVGDNEGTLYEPPPAEKIHEMLKVLYDYANTDDSVGFIHPVIKAINLHFYLAYIHPFNDGNGRTARALFYWYMLRKKYWMMEYLTISRIFIQAPTQYKRAFLYTELDDLDLTYFISFNIRVITLAIKVLKEYIVRKQKEISNISVHLKKYPELNERQREVLGVAIDNPDSQYTIEGHQTTNNVTYETARRDLADLEEKKLLDKVKKGKKFYYVASKNLIKTLKLH
ncbi:MAG: Fic family protein [Candidatus Omnitrophica bacterium]|jgi:Fic family protein|nr:Fic family protein [Candidatus Omnitrophota bacterium]MDD3088037.1 Fic family protein [Candidatus Omnitrophota bacterium]